MGDAININAATWHCRQCKSGGRGRTVMRVCRVQVLLRY